jgi:hypothetical protein
MIAFSYFSPKSDCRRGECCLKIGWVVYEPSELTLAR